MSWVWFPVAPLSLQPYVLSKSTDNNNVNCALFRHVALRSWNIAPSLGLAALTLRIFPCQSQLICNLYRIYIASVCCAWIKVYSSTWTQCCIESLLITPSAMPTNTALTSKCIWNSKDQHYSGDLAWALNIYMHVYFALPLTPPPPPPPPPSFTHALPVFQTSSK